MPADPATVKAVFLAALARPTDGWAAYLDEACAGDPGLRGQVEALLRAHAEPDSLLDAAEPGTAAYVPDAPAPHEPRRPDAAGYTPGERVGPYKLLEKIGEGGMGEVWVADQLEPIKRRVAIKVIKPGMDSRAVLARFEAERQALALMDHPNIAKVLDAGTTPDGRPFFVMELVKGVPITDSCDARRLDARARLELFVPVCRAIQHAHSKGVIHRDIKPTNVLVELHDETAVPKVIDFGVAKAVGQPLTEMTLYTGFGALVGTPAYMAPEQATFNALDVDTRADVYALGVLLYELLAGSPPFDPDRLKRAALDEVLRLVREEEPPRPSARLSTSRTKAAIAAVRQTDPNRLSRLMRGELDWIVMRALEKDRNRRYDTAAGFARDVERYLRNEPVEACPPTVGYRLRTLYRKNRAVVTVGAVVGLVLLAATGVSVAFGLAAKRAGAEAESDRAAAVDARTDAETRRAEAIALAADLRQTTYFAHMGLAAEALAVGNVTQARSLLDRHRPGPGEPDPRGFEWHLLRRALHAERQTFPDHPWMVGGVALSPDGKWLATISALYTQTREQQGEVRVYEAATGRLRSTAAVDWNVGWSLAYSPDGKHLAACGWRWVRSGDRTDYLFGEARVWDAVTGRDVSARRYDGRQAERLVFAPDGRRLAFVCRSGSGRDVRAKVIDPVTGSELEDLPAPTPAGEPDAACFPAFAPDGRLLWAIGGATARVVDGRSGDEWFAVGAEGGRVTKLRLSPDGTRLAGVYADHQVRVWDVRPGARRLVGHFQEESLTEYDQLAFSPDGRRLAVAGQDREVARVWDVEAGRRVWVSRGHATAVAAVAFGPDGTTLATGSHDRTAKLWDLTPRAESGPVRLAPAGFGIGFRPDGGVSAAVIPQALSPRQPTATPRVIDVASGATLFEPPMTGPVAAWTTLLSGDGSLLATESRAVTGAAGGTSTLWDVGRRRTHAAWPAGEVKGRVLWLGPAGRRAAVVREDQSVEVWDLESGRVLHRLPARGAYVERIAVSADGTRLVTANRDQTTRVWDLAAGREMSTLQGPGWSFDPRLSPDGSRVAGGKWEEAGLGAAIWDGSTGRVVHQLAGHTNRVTAVAFSPDGRRVVTGASDRTVRVWDAATGQEIMALRGYDEDVWHLAFSPDGRRLATLSRSNAEARVWDATPLPGE